MGHLQDIISALTLNGCLQISSPSCDSQGLHAEEAPPSEPQSPVTQTSNGATRPNSCQTPLSLVSRAKPEQPPPTQVEAATPCSVVCTPVAKRLWEGGSSRDGAGSASGGGGGARKVARYSQETVRGSTIQSPGSLPLAISMGATGPSLAGALAGGTTNTNGGSGASHGMSDGASPGTLSTYASDSPISYHDDEEEEEGTDESAEEQYRQICNMYTMYSMLNMGAAGKDTHSCTPDATCPPLKCLHSYTFQLRGSVWKLCRITRRHGDGCEGGTSRVSLQNWSLRSATAVIQNCTRKETPPRSWS